MLYITTISQDIKLKTLNSFDYIRNIEYIESYPYTTYAYNTKANNKK